MTESEAIKMLEIQKPAYGCKEYKKPLMYAYEMAIKALEEVQQYRAIGTPEELQTAMEKQMPKKSVHDGCFDSEGIWHEWNGVNGRPYDLCPKCNTNLCCEMPYDNKPKYCKHCGQRLDWSDEE